MATSKAGLNSQAYAELQEAVASLQAQIDNLGGGVFKLIGRDFGTIASGVTGDILTRSLIDYPGATHIRIVYLYTDFTDSQVGVSVITEKGTVISGTLADYTPVGTTIGSQFAIAANPPAAASSVDQRPYGGILAPIYCDTFTISKNAGNTIVPIAWAVEYGVVE